MAVEAGAQHHSPRPETVEDLLALLAAGALITTGGKTMVRRTCPACGTRLLGSAGDAETCTCAMPCPTCLAPPGRRCRRPSEHGVFGNRPHGARVQTARDDTERRAAAGDPDIPARWSETVTESGEPQPALW